MLAEMIQELVSLGQQKNRLQVDRVEELEKVFTTDSVGVTTEHEVPPPRRRSVVFGLDDLILAAQTFSSGLVELFHSPLGVALLAQGGDHRLDTRSSWSLSFATSERFQRLETLKQGMGFSPRDLIEFLRFDLGGGDSVAPVIQAARNIDFSRSSGGAHTTEHGRESLGRSVESKIQNRENFPEEFVVRTPLYANQGFRALTMVEVRVGVTINAASEEIDLRIPADELYLAQDVAHVTISERLIELLPNAQVYFGTPSGNGRWE